MLTYTFVHLTFYAPQIVAHGHEDANVYYYKDKNISE